VLKFLLLGEKRKLFSNAASSQISQEQTYSVLMRSPGTRNSEQTKALYQRALIRTHCPFAVSDGHDLPWLLDEFVPGFATQGDNIMV
jgi:hypothetical protein